MGKAKKEVWRYMGRILDGKALFHSYHDEKGELRVFKKLPATSPGALYEVEVERKKDGGIVVHGRPTYHSEQIPADSILPPAEEEAIRLEAQADDRAVSIELETSRAEKAGAYQEIEENLDALRSLYQRQKGGRRAAFLAHVIQRVTRR